MKERDKAILRTLQAFRVMTREQIQSIHFPGLKTSVNAANSVLLRLKRQGLIDVSKERRMYMYYPVPSIKKDSAKLQHYLALCNLYLECRGHDQPKRFTIEPKLGEKGMPEPDIFMIWLGAPFFVELQRNIFSQKVMDAKLRRYEDYYDSGAWKVFDWQPAKPIFPRVWMLTDHKYDVQTSFPFVQTKNVTEFIMRYKR